MSGFLIDTNVLSEYNRPDLTQGSSTGLKLRLANLSI